jgi:ABC-2 type transport system permease protein
MVQSLKEAGEIILMAWMYLSAIFYPISVLPDRLQVLMSLNPLYHYTEKSL